MPGPRIPAVGFFRVVDDRVDAISSIVIIHEAADALLARDKQRAHKQPKIATAQRAHAVAEGITMKQADDLALIRRRQIPGHGFVAGLEEEPGTSGGQEKQNDHCKASLPDREFES